MIFSKNFLNFNAKINLFNENMINVTCFIKEAGFFLF